MLIEELPKIVTERISIKEMSEKAKKLLALATPEEFGKLMFDSAGEPARQALDSILNEYDGRSRQQILRDMAQEIAEEDRDFFIHAFSSRGSY